MESINPYAPTSLTVETPVKLEKPKSAVTTLSVAMRTISGISIAGGVFGLGMVTLVMLSSGGGDPAMVLGLGIAFGFGMALAAISGLLTVLVLIGLIHGSGQAGDLWTARQIRCFSVTAGGISGFICLAVPAGFQLQAIFWAMIPGFIGAIGALIMTSPCAKLAEKQRMIALGESASPAPLSFETQSI